MGYQDRAYTRSSGGGGWNIFNWLFTGSIPLFTAFGIRVRAHASLVVLIALVLLLGLGQGFSLSDRVISMSVLFGVVLLHEFGHCFAARAVGGTAEDILMSPLGGLAFAAPPRRPFPTFVTVACGPLVNVLLMLLAAVVIYGVGGTPSWNPFRFAAPPETPGSSVMVWAWAAWFFAMNYWLLLFNLLPSYPLDGGQLVQSVLWKFVGYYRSMVIATTVGMVGAGGMIAFGVLGLNFLLIFVGVSCLMTSMSMRAQVRAAGPWAFQEEEDADYSAAQWRPSQVSAKDAKAEAKAIARAQAEAAREDAEQRKIDAILEKVGREGMQSLSWLEKRTLKKATERQRQRTLRSRR